MSISFDRDLIARAAAKSAAQGTWLGLLITSTSLERFALASRVRDAVGGLDRTDLVYPLATGALVAVTTPAEWEQVVVAIGAGLGDEGEIRLTLPELRPPGEDLLDFTRPAVTAFRCYTVSPPPASGPFNEFGVLVARRGFAPNHERALLERGATWASLAGPRGQAGMGFSIPACLDDAADILELELARGPQQARLEFFDERTRQLRAVNVGTFGQVGYTEVPGNPDSIVPAAESLAATFVAEADELDVAMIQMTDPYSSGTHTALTDAGLWGKSPHLRSSRVFDASAIQLLTTAHLDLATDLSSWRVESAGTDRWLVQAKDLAPWFDFVNHWEWARGNVSVETPDVVVAARQDFGEMILTREIAAQHPIGPRS